MPMISRKQIYGLAVGFSDDSLLIKRNFWALRGVRLVSQKPHA